MLPSLSIETIWRDGGMTGELIVKRIIEGLPHHLREGGTLFVCRLVWIQVKGPLRTGQKVAGESQR